MDGVRALAMMWVVIGHVYSDYLISGVENMINITDFANKPFFLVLGAGLLAVDVFFMLGGFFLAFIILRTRMTIWKYILAIPQRALRIWPAYIVAMMFYYSLMMPMGNGPLWVNMQADTYYCDSMWK